MVTEVKTEDGSGGGCGTERGCGCGSESEWEVIRDKTSDGSESGCGSGCGCEHEPGKAECLTGHGSGCGRGCGSGSGSEWGISVKGSGRPSAIIHRQATMPILGNGRVTRERAANMYRSHQDVLTHFAQELGLNLEDSKLWFGAPEFHNGSPGNEIKADGDTMNGGDELWWMILCVLVYVLRRFAPTRRQRIRHSFGAIVGRTGAGGRRLCSGIESAAS